jgi:type VI protein secretion system component VasK
MKTYFRIFSITACVASLLSHILLSSDGNYATTHGIVDILMIALFFFGVACIITLFWGKWTK